MRVLLLAGGKLLVIATRSAAAVEPLEELLQIGHGEGDFGRFYSAQISRAGRPEPLKKRNEKTNKVL